MQNRRSLSRHRHWLTALLLCSLIFTAYLATAARDITFEHYGGDGGDLITAAWTLGVPHPPGYPTYTVLGWMFTHLEIGTIAFRVTLLSSASGALALFFLFLSSWELQPENDRSLVVPIASTAILGFSPLYWSQSIIAEVYTLLAFFAACLLYLLIKWRNGGPNYLLPLAGLLLGIGLGNHLTLVFIVPAALVLLFMERKRWLRWQILLPTIFLFLLGLTIYAYLPWAARRAGPVNWGNPQTWDQFLWLVTAEQYQPFVFGLPLENIPTRFWTWLTIFNEQFDWWGLIIAGLGGYAWWVRDRWFFGFTLAWGLPLFIYTFAYNTVDSYMILIPLFILLAIWWGEGARVLILIGDQITRRTDLPSTTLPAAFWRWWPRLIILLLPLASMTTHWQLVSVRGDTTAREYVDQTLESLPEESLLITRRDKPTFSLWYEVFTNEVRTDVALVNARMLAYRWYRDQIREQYPDIVVPRVKDDMSSDELVYEFILANEDTHLIFATDPVEAWEDFFLFDPVGETPVYRVSSAGTEID